jgi:hypothetical protein
MALLSSIAAESTAGCSVAWPADQTAAAGSHDCSHQVDLNHNGVLGLLVLLIQLPDLGGVS